MEFRFTVFHAIHEKRVSVAMLQKRSYLRFSGGKDSKLALSIWTTRVHALLCDPRGMDTSVTGKLTRRRTKLDDLRCDFRLPRL